MTDPREFLRTSAILTDEQRRELFDAIIPANDNPKGWLTELVKRQWLTKYQAVELLNGRGQNLILGSYVLLDRLGEGGMGQVFKARNWKMGRLVAIKLIQKDRLTSPDAIRRFQREIRAASTLNHPNIVTAYDADETNGIHYFAMEHVDGIDLSRLVKDRGPLPVDAACECIRQAALGLQHAHEHGMVHRDIKPGNFLLSTENKVKLLDMGLARMEGSGENTFSGTMTAEGSVMGTPDFIAPEQALESHTVDIRADLYSLGCTFYYLLTGRVPYPGGTMMQKLMKHRLEEPTAIEFIRTDVPAPVIAIVRRLMAKRPEDRFQTPAELAEALRDPSQAAVQAVARLATQNAPTLGDNPFANFDSSIPSVPTPKMTPRPTALKEGRKPPLAFIAGAAVVAAVVVLAGIGILIRSMMKKDVPRGASTAVASRTAPTTRAKTAAEATAEADKKRQAEEAEAEKKRVAASIAAFPAVEAGLPVTGLLFTTPEHFVDVPKLKLDRTRPFTIEAYVTPKSINPRTPGHIAGWAGQASLYITESSGLCAFSIYIGGDLHSIHSEATYTDRRIHVAGVRTADSIRIFEDGKLVASKPVSGPLVDAENVPFRIGSYGFTGIVSQVRVSSTARYTADFKPGAQLESDKDTLALYRFDEGAGNKLTDSSGNDRHGAIIGATWMQPARAATMAEQMKQRQIDAATALGVPVQLENSIGMKLILIPAGKFKMGTSDVETDAINNAKPQHAVHVQNHFQLGAHEVTQEQFQRIMGVNPSQFKAGAGGGPDHPVEKVTWAEAMEFCKRLSSRPEEVAAGRTYRLPTEAEWEYACRAGSTDWFHYGRDPKILPEYGWSGDKEGTTHPVGKLKPNAWGLHDMHGNVAEWCSDWYSANYYAQSPTDNPPGPAGGTERVARGGSFGNHFVAVRSYIRGGVPPTWRLHSLGFRVACDTRTPDLAQQQAERLQADLAKDIGHQVQITNSIGMKLNLIPAGRYGMGAADDEPGKYDGEGPRHDVSLTRHFYLGETEVTIGQFREFVNAEKYKTDVEQKKSGCLNVATIKADASLHWQSPGAPVTADSPVTCISRGDAIAFCQWLSKKENRRYRLPTEAEWERACRAGSTTPYYWGDESAQIDAFAWHMGNAKQVQPAARKRANAWGLYDMCGNAWEWCSDRYQKNYPRGPAIDPQGPAEGTGVIRGGSFADPPRSLRSARRFSWTAASNAVGFRVVCETDVVNRARP